MIVKRSDTTPRWPTIHPFTSPTTHPLTPPSTHIPTYPHTLLTTPTHPLPTSSHTLSNPLRTHFHHPPIHLADEEEEDDEDYEEPSPEELEAMAREMFDELKNPKTEKVTVKKLKNWDGIKEVMDSGDLSKVRVTCDV